MEPNTHSSSTGSIPQKKLGITSPYVIKIMSIIKDIQKRMKDPDVINLDYARVYDKLGKEFDEFFTKFTRIFINVLRGELDIVAANLYYLDKVVNGEMKESEVADLLAKRFLPENLKQESDAKLQEMKDTNMLQSVSLGK